MDLLVVIFRYLTIRCLALVITLVAINCPRAAVAQDGQTRVVNREYYLKAAFLYHFTSFISWPDAALGDESIEIGVLGQDPFGPSLDTIDGKIVSGRTIVVKRSHRVEDLQSCAVLFIARSEQGRLPEIFSEIIGRPILTVSEIEGFAHRWGAINFTASGNRVHFEINSEAMKRAHLRVSSRLMRVATVVDDRHPVSAHP